MNQSRFSVQQLLGDRNPLAQFYARFDVEHRLLFTGHSHQAWPDCARTAVIEAFDDAARHVDDKWAHAEQKAEAVRRGYAERIGAAAGEITLGQNTHELLVRLLSALDLPARPRLVTTDGEFHSARRQLDRLEEAGVEIVRVPRTLHEGGLQGLTDALDERTAAVVVSSVSFIDARIHRDFRALAQACSHHGCALIVDTYHMVNVVPMDLHAMGLSEAFVLGGGYKYCQLGEGNCFLRAPENCRLRPVITGWYAEFGALDRPRDADDKSAHPVDYARGPARFSGSTYDPTANYRGARVFGFFDELGLTPELLRALAVAHNERIVGAFAASGLDPGIIRGPAPGEVESLAGFVVFELASPEATSRVVELCRARALAVDHRGHRLRIGSAPYNSLAQIDRAMEILVDAVRSL